MNAELNRESDIAGSWGDLDCERPGGEESEPVMEIRGKRPLVSLPKVHCIADLSCSQSDRAVFVLKMVFLTKCLPRKCIYFYCYNILNRY